MVGAYGCRHRTWIALRWHRPSRCVNMSITNYHILRTRMNPTIWLCQTDANITPLASGRTIYVSCVQLATNGVGHRPSPFRECELALIRHT